MSGRMSTRPGSCGLREGPKARLISSEIPTPETGRVGVGGGHTAGLALLERYGSCNRRRLHTHEFVCIDIICIGSWDQLDGGHVS